MRLKPTADDLIHIEAFLFSSQELTEGKRSSGRSPFRRRSGQVVRPIHSMSEIFCQEENQAAWFYGTGGERLR
jgi:hypothetical protein